MNKTKHWYEKAKGRAAELNLDYPMIAESLGVTPGTIGHYLNGRRDPHTGALVKLARTLQMSVSELVEDDPIFARNEDEIKILELWRLIEDQGDKSAALRLLEAMKEKAKKTESAD